MINIAQLAAEVIEAVERSNTNVGGNVVEQAGQWAVVRGLGLIESTADVENIVIGSSNGTPVYVRNVAEVTTMPWAGLATTSAKGRIGSRTAVS